MTKPIDRTCEAEDCDRKRVARGLCSMHWKRQYGKRTKYLRTCDTCGVEFKSDRPTGRFCSDDCKGLAYMVERRTRSRALEPVTDGAYCSLPVRPAHVPVLWRARTWYAGTCQWCGSAFVDNQPMARYCSAWCGQRMGCTRNRRRKGWPQLNLTPVERRALYERDSWTCWLCTEMVDQDLTATSPNDDWAASLDHVIPRSAGGSDDPSNLRLAHRWCNSVRSDETHHTPDVLRLTTVAQVPLGV